LQNKKAKINRLKQEREAKVKNQDATRKSGPFFAKASVHLR